MLPLYPAKTIKDWDAFTIKHEPVGSADLMDRAALACMEWLVQRFPVNRVMHIVCGNGNNGGDGLALARMLFHSGYEVHVYLQADAQRSDDNQLNLVRLKNFRFREIHLLNDRSVLPSDDSGIIVDAIFGTGVRSGLQGFWKEIIEQINQSACRVISIDIPSGLPADPETVYAENDDLKPETIVQADHTLTFQLPKRSMLMVGLGNYCGAIHVLNIGLSSEFPVPEQQKEYYIEGASALYKIFRKRPSFTHKGDYGHVLLIAGNKGTCGAAALAAKAAIKSGAGLVSVASDAACAGMIQQSAAEIMLYTGSLENLKGSHKFTMGIGPGMGTDQIDLAKLQVLLKHCMGRPVVMDADAITLLAKHKTELNLPENSILTPHPAEFDRLVGPSLNGWQRLRKASDYAVKHQVILVLKGAHTVICAPDGKQFVNSSGNPGMATAGSGDVLTGIITALLAQKYEPLEAAILGVYCHGKAGDLAAETLSQTGMTASDIIAFLNPVFREFENY